MRLRRGLMWPHGHIKFTRCCCTRQLIDYLCSKMRLRRGLMCPDLYCRIFSATITTYNYFIQPNSTLSDYEAQIPHPFMLPFVLGMYQRKQGARICYPHLIWWHESLCRQHSGVGHHWNRFCNWLQSSTPWVTHYFRVSGSVNQETSFETGDSQDNRYFGFEGNGPGTIQMGYHTDNYIYGMCIWSVIY